MGPTGLMGVGRLVSIPGFYILLSLPLGDTLGDRDVHAMSLEKVLQKLLNLLSKMLT